MESENDLNKKMKYHLSMFVDSLAQTVKNEMVAALQPNAIAAPASITQPKQVTAQADPDFECQCSQWRNGPCPNPNSPADKSRTKMPKNPAEPNGPKGYYLLSVLCKKEYTKATNAGKPKAPRKRSAPKTATAADVQESASKKATLNNVESAPQKATLNNGNNDDEEEEEEGEMYEEEDEQNDVDL